MDTTTATSATSDTSDRPAPTRYRCTACGNLTRFDVLETTTVRSYHHFTVGGELTIEDAEVLEHRVSEISCRWCGNGAAVVELDDAANAADGPAPAADDPPPV